MNTDLSLLGDQNAHMTAALWQEVDHFSYDEEWGDPYKMWVRLIYYLDRLRKDVNRPIKIHNGWELRDSGWHPTGAASDLHCPTMGYKELAFRAMQFPFTGIGLYPFWNQKGLHLDVRPLGKTGKRKLWWRDERGEYHNINNFTDFSLVDYTSFS